MRCDAVQGFGQPVQPAMDMRKYLDVPFRCDHVHQASPTVELFAHSCRVVFTFTPSDGKVVGVCWCTYSLRQCLCSLASSYTILRFKLHYPALQVALKQGALKQFASSVVGVCLPQSCIHQAINSSAMHDLFHVLLAVVS